MSIFSPHIPFTELTELAEAQSKTSPEALAHLAACSECSRQFESIKQTLNLMRTDTAEDAPAELVQFAKKIFREKVVTRGPHRVLETSRPTDRLTRRTPLAIAHCRTSATSVVATLKGAHSGRNPEKDR